MKDENIKEPKPFSTMPHQDDMMGKHEVSGHVAHHKHFGKHSAGHKLHHESVKEMCKGGKA
jgi:hypothetical protein